MKTEASQRKSTCSITDMHQSSNKGRGALQIGRFVDSLEACPGKIIHLQFLFVLLDVASIWVLVFARSGRVSP